MKPKIINIISGKGGTGKTLFCAILAEMLGNKGAKVLVIDTDVFVRGLTALLYFHKGETLHLISEGEWAISDYFISRSKVFVGLQGPLSIHKYRSFDVCPSVPRIDVLLNLNDLAPNTRDEARKIFESILSDVPPGYDYVFLDSRAGYDEVIAATHVVSTVSVCVQEDDDISNVTADNLIRQLESDSGVPLFRMINKARDARNADRLGKSGLPGVSYLGSIPFDMDVMDSFGRESFWDEIARSLYKSSAARVWNRLATRMSFAHVLSEFRRSPFPSEDTEGRLGYLGLTQRVMVLYGLTIGIFGFLYGILGRGFIENIIDEPLRILSLIVGFVLSLGTLVFLLRKPRRK